MIECSWQAWYHRLPGTALPPLHVAADVRSDEPLGELRLIEDIECDCPPDVICLDLEAGADLAPGQTDQEVSWTGRPDRPISEVRVAGLAAASIGVRDAR